MEERRKLTELAYRYIFDSLMNGKFRSGSYINVDDLSSSLNMSKTPVREALVELEGEGLVVRDRRYYHVFSLSKKEVMDLYEVRLILERETAGLAAERATREQMKELQGIITKIRVLSRQSDPDAISFADLSGKFHSQIAKCSSNDRIVEILSDIRLRLKIIRVTSFTSFNRRIDDVEEHETVFQAIKDRDPELARRKMAEHIGKVMQFVRNELLIQFYD